MLRDYRDWLQSELRILGNASHHAYSLGQANMAKRALDEFDKERAATLYVGVETAAARQALTELELLHERDTSLPPGLAKLVESIRVALAEAQPPADEAV